MKTFNDLFALVLTALIGGLWAAHGAGLIALPEIILGATLSIQTLIVQFYFRRAPPGNSTPPPP